MHIKKGYIIVFVVLTISVGLYFWFHSGRNELELIQDTSFFSKYEVNGDKVYIYCEVEIRNNSSLDSTCKINALFKEDKELGLLKSGNLAGYNVGKTEDEFFIPSNSNQSFSIVFIGDYAGTYKKSNRELPEIILTKLNIQRK